MEDKSDSYLMSKRDKIYNELCKLLSDKDCKNLDKLLDIECELVSRSGR